MTGALDIVTDGTRMVRVANGHPMMAAVTGTGCMATSVVAAYAAVETDLVAAAAIALAAYGLAGELAARNARGPGSLHVGLYDELAGLTEESLRAGLRIEVARQ
jgi:hydroxyethylthiazole kinase